MADCQIYHRQCGLELKAGGIKLGLRHYRLGVHADHGGTRHAFVTTFERKCSRTVVAALSRRCHGEVYPVQGSECLRFYHTCFKSGPICAGVS